jgi:DNA-binding MarR family transcriptional regulator
MAPGGEKLESSAEDPTIVLGILQAIESGERITQRAVAAELGIALGLVNAYLRRCMNKGFVKIKSAPARRYAYYLTPKGFAAKSRLTANYLAHSFSFFRTARADCDSILAQASARRMQQVALLGIGELAEILILCATNHQVRLAAIVDRTSKVTAFAGLPVVHDFESLKDVDGIMVTDLKAPATAYAAAVAAVGVDRVLAPALLKIGRAASRPQTKGKP